MKPDPTQILSPEDAEWRALLLAAKDLFQLAPWAWMGDAQHVGVRDPETGETGWCAVMGSDGELMGVAVYLGDEGYEFFRRLLSEDVLHDEGMFGQEALLVFFGDREELSPEERARIRRLGVAFRGRGRWPQLLRQTANHVPEPLPVGDVRRMRLTLEQLALTAERAYHEPALAEPDAQGRRLVRVLHDGTWRDERVPEPAVRERTVPDFDRVRAERLRRSLKRSGLRIECDCRPGPALLQEPGEAPCAAAMFLAVVTETGVIAHMAMREPAGREAWSQEQLLGAVEALGEIPSVIYLMRPSLDRVLSPVCTALGIVVERVDALHSIAEASEFIASSMSDEP